MNADITDSNSTAARVNGQQAEPVMVQQEPASRSLVKTRPAVIGAPWAQAIPVSSRPRPSNPWLGL